MMVVSREKMIGIRIRLLKDMDSFIRDRVDNEGLVMTWFMGGLPDGYDEIDLVEIAGDDEIWDDCVECFRRILKKAGLI